MARKDAPLEDLLRAANAGLAIVEGDPLARALPLLERAERIDRDDPVLLWCRYHVASIRHDQSPPEGEQDPERDERVQLLRRLRSLRPEAFTVTLALASTLDGFDRAETEKEAEQLYRELERIPVEFTGEWRASIVYCLMQILIRKDGETPEVKDLLAEIRSFEERQIKAPSDRFHSYGTLGVVPPHTPRFFDRPAPEPLDARLTRRTLPFEGPAGVRALHLDWGTDLQDIGRDPEEVFSARTLGSVVAWGAGGVALVDGAGAPRALWDARTSDLADFDRMNHGVDRVSDALTEKKKGDRDLDLLAFAPQGDRSNLHLLENVGGSWSVRADPLVELPAVESASNSLPVDFDADGDVDLLVCTSPGLRVLRNDGLDGRGGFTDATVEAGLPVGNFRPLAEDMDRDGDIDFLLIERESGALHLASNERGGRFSDGAALLPAGLRGTWIVPADYDGDGWLDLAVFGSDLSLHTRTPLGSWRDEVRRFPLASAPTGEPRAVDWDLDGAFDLLWPCAEAPAAGWLAPGFSPGGLTVTLGERASAPIPGPATLHVVDLDGDHDFDLLRIDASGLNAYLAEGAGRGVLLALQGYKSNARGVGAVLELRTGLLYRRISYRGTPELVGFGGQGVEEAAITWPNGVWQANFDFASGTERILAERPGQVGSCPFLYTWNGSNYEFISDVLGITPLGLPMAPGMPGAPPLMVPPDHDEYVLVKGEQLVPKDGVLEMHFTEELREVTYLDRIRLDVVDHPADTEVYPNERFSFPPFPEAHTHTVKDPLAPLSAVDQNGKDWTDELARDDKRFALPFESLSGQYRGLATPYTVELAFDAERVRSASKLRLFLNGWFYWTDASVNVAVARHPDFDFVPPILSVPNGQGGWKECGPIGFPAGKLKTMAADVSELLNRDDPRIRLFSTLRLYWDSIRLATDADDAPRVTTALEPISANLWQRGFSRSFPLLGEHDCEWFEWDELEAEPRWNQHPGRYTKLGEALPLVSAIDDRFVIMGAGDALTVRFDATELPPLPAGWRRDYLVFLDGWAKDRDPNTLEALYVEPLPFHGMSGYPYRADERYPDDEAHRAYCREWNTRPAHQWIQSLVPPRSRPH